MKAIIPPFIIFSLFCLFTFSCKKEATLPPQASHEPWQFGNQAYLHTKNILDIGPRPIESDGHKKVQAYITTNLKKHGWEIRRQSFKTKTPFGDRNFVNLIARHKDAMKSPNIVLAAHYDSKLLDGFLGADDAASCVGALLEFAEHLPSEHNPLARQIEFVFFDGEEALTPNIEYLKDGLYGSIYYSQYMRNDVASEKKTYLHIPKFGMVLDMIGHKNLSIKIPSDTPYSLLQTYFNVIEKYKLQDSFGVAQGSILDDHYPMNMIADLPTIDLIGDFSSKSWWHTKNDNFNLISEKSLNTSIRVALEIIKQQATKLKLGEDK